MTPDHPIARAQPPDDADRRALRATLEATHLMGLAAGGQLAELRAMDDPLATALARARQAELQVRLLGEVVSLLVGRFAKLPERRRPHYSPEARFRILELRHLLSWPLVETARKFLVCTNTIANWEAATKPATRTVGSLLKPTPPIRRLADVVRRLAQTLGRLGFGGEERIAMTLARAGWRLSARSVRRFRKERPTHAPASPPDHREKRRPIQARFAHHVWMLDVTEVKALLSRRRLHIAAVFDGFSRAPLAVSTHDQPPKAGDMARLLRAARRAFGRPRYVITDLGGEFTGQAFQRAVRQVGARHRYAAARNHYATARLERFWRTLKDTASLRSLRRPASLDELERRLESGLAFYVVHRPHQALAGATPGEVLLGLEPTHLKAVPPPRGRPGEGPARAPFEVHYVDPEAREHPFLVAA